MSKQYQSRAYLVGYYGMQNTGDDALMAAAIAGAKKHLHVDTIQVSSPSELKTFAGDTFDASLKAKQSFPGQNRLLSYLRAIDSNRVIFGGGSVFHNARDIDLKRDLMMLSGGRSHLALGVGLGPFVNTKAEKSCARFLNECHFTGLRDPKSYEIAKAIAPDANVALTFDLAPQLLDHQGFELKSVPRQGIAVCLCPKERLNGDVEAETKRLKRLALALDKIQNLTKEVIYFVDFNGHDVLGDRAVHEELASYLPASSMYQFIHYDANPFRVLQRIAGFKLAISMRLHASIFAYLTETPILSLNYHQKCSEWCTQIGLDASQIFALDDLDPDELAKTATLGLAHGFYSPALSVRDAQHRSMKNWRMSYEQANETSVHGCYSSL